MEGLLLKLQNYQKHENDKPKSERRKSMIASVVSQISGPRKKSRFISGFKSFSRDRIRGGRKDGRGPAISGEAISGEAISGSIHHVNNGDVHERAVTTLDILGETPTEQMEADVMRHTANPMCEVESSTGAPAVRGQTKLGEQKPVQRAGPPHRQPQQRGDPGTREYMQ
jgi:hypothetical protein